MTAPVVAGEKEKQAFEGKMHELEEKAKEDEAAARAASLGFLHTNLKAFPIALEAVALIAREKAEELKVVCFLFTGDELRVGAVDPTDAGVADLLHELTERHRAHGALYLISEASFARALKLYDLVPTPRKIVKGVEITEAELKKFDAEVATFADLEAHAKSANVTDLVAMTIASALKASASDIHLEAEEKGIAVRFRLDGILNNAATIAPERWKEIISRIKLIAGLKINVADKPQDGRFTIYYGNVAEAFRPPSSGNLKVSATSDRVDVRVSTIPTAYGESVVMRLLRGTAVGLKFEDLGIRGKAFEVLKREVERPNGMIITTGPTGSGKTTTLYAFLNKLNTPETKIITLEDPVEYRLAGINQSQIDPSKNYSFANGLRSILRQDPDVIMVGEVRDLETAEISIQAALTGHLVLSTIHTNSAAGAVPRFLSMGVKPFLLAPALNAVIGQRLVRKICPTCKVEDTLDAETLERVKKFLPDAKQSLKFFKGGGCKECFGLGYKGRIGIYEVMVMTKDIEQVILSKEISEYKMQELAVAAGMIPMVADGLLKALDGITSVEEVFRVAE